MSDQYREVSTTPWGKRIVSSLFGILIGLLMFLGSFWLIWSNEGRSVDRIKTLDEGRNLVVSISADYINAALNDNLVHVSAIADSDKILKDTAFGVEEKALKLRRKVEFFQWQESSSTQTTKNIGGSETTEKVYSYHKVWHEGLIDSSRFKVTEGHRNPSSSTYESATKTADNIHIGAFRLSYDFVRQIDNYEAYPLTQIHFDQMDAQFRDQFLLNDQIYYLGNPNDPQIGAMRMSYSIIRPQEMSVIGKQSNSDIVSYKTDIGEIELLDVGIIDAPSMFSSAENENFLFTWLIRVGAFILMWVGLVFILSPIRVLADVVPLIGRIFGAGIGLITGIIALVLSFITMALAWLFFRPLIGGILLLIALFSFFGGIKMIRKKYRQFKNQAQQSDASFQ